MAISNMQQPQQMQGGLGALDAPRQGYFLGKLVKKATRAVKKVAKSPLGKAAMIGALGFGIPGTSIGGLFGRASFGRAATGLLGKQGIAASLPSLFGRGLAAGVQGPTQQGMFGKLASGFGKLSPGQKVFAGLGATALAAPLFMGGDDEPEEVSEVMDVANIRNRARNMYSGEGDAGAGLSFMPAKKYVNQNFYAADGGRAGYAMGGNIEEEDEEEFIRSGAGQSFRPRETFLNMGGGAGDEQAKQMLQAEFVKYKNKGGDLSFEQFVQAVMQQQQQSQGMEQPTMMAADGGMAGMTVPGYGTPAGTNQFGYPSGGERVNAAEGGIMETEEASEMIDMGGNEKDFRETGGFVEMGGEERADDVPARLSKNEFVFTADAVRNAGGGDIDRGSEVMQNLMDNLEQGGQVSEDSQGLGGGEEMMSEEIIEEPNGAQAMYEQQQALQSRIA